MILKHGGTTTGRPAGGKAAAGWAGLLALLLLAGAASSRQGPAGGAELPPLRAAYSGDLGSNVAVLSLYAWPAHNHGAYQLALVPLVEGEGVAGEVLKGRWTVLKGAPQLPKATVYQLDPERPATARFFLRTGPDTLRLFDPRDRAADPRTGPPLLRMEAAGPAR